MKSYRNSQGLLHRTDGPAIEFADGSKSWFINGQRHRTDGPAVIYTNGYKAWWINGQRHRTDGPARIKSGGSKEWFINGKRLTEKEFNRQRFLIPKELFEL